MKVHCNKTECQKEFEANVTRQRFGGAQATRTNEMVQCPHCGKIDSQWVYASDVMPVFEGGFDARKRAARQWTTDN